MKHKPSHTYLKGMLLVEVVIAVGMIGLIFWSLISLQVTLLRAKHHAIKKVQATYRAIEALEAARRVRDRVDFLTLQGGVTSENVCVALAAGDWQITGSCVSQTGIDGIFTRVVAMSPVRRNSATGEISTSPADPIDANTRKVVATVSWSGSSGVTLETYLTNWRKTIVVSTPTSFIQLVSAKGDDAEEYADGSVYISDGPGSDVGDDDLDLQDPDKEPSAHAFAGVRFSAVTVPKDASIVGATITFTADEADSTPTTATIWGEYASNPGGFSNGPVGTYSVSNRRIPGTIPVTWVVPPASAGGAKIITVDISPIVQQLVTQSSWVSGNAMVFIFQTDGERDVRAADYDINRSTVGNTPLLKVFYR